MKRWFVRSIVTALAGATLLVPAAAQAAQRGQALKPADKKHGPALTVQAGSVAPGQALKPSDKK